MSSILELSDQLSAPEDSNRNPYRGAIFVLIAAAVLGTAGATFCGLKLGNMVLLDTAVTFGFSTGILIGVLAVRMAGATWQKPKRNEARSMPALADEGVTTEEAHTLPETERSNAISAPTNIAVLFWHRLQEIGTAGTIRGITAGAAMIAIAILLLSSLQAFQPILFMAGIVGGLCLVAAGLAATAAHYFSDIKSIWLPEARNLAEGARVVTWILAIAAISVGLEWMGQYRILQVLHFAILAVNAAVCYGLLTMKRPGEEAPGIFPLDIGVLSMLGGRANLLGSILDAGERQLGIDLRSTWALTIVRRSLEPLVVSLCLLGWLSTCLTVVGIQEQGLVERLGVPLGGQPLQPGLHLHWPWPVDQVNRIPMQRVQALQVGHEGEESEGPENVLWAVEHAPNEYTLVLGNGRDLITVDAAVQYRITDARAWRYHCQNPAEALHAIAYRAVMISTVNRTLSDALSENVSVLTGQMRARVQEDADALGLGVQILSFTVGGMHPPVPVAADYEAVVSAELGKVTSAVNAQVYRNVTVPAAEASVATDENSARAEGVNALALAAGEAWSFRALEAQYRAAPTEYFFRRRLETMEKNLGGLHFTIVDSRIQRDGGEIWLTR